jgi:hypothetical protein
MQTTYFLQRKKKGKEKKKRRRKRKKQEKKDHQPWSWQVFLDETCAIDTSAYLQP